MAIIFANRIRLSFPQKTIWLYTGFKWYDIFNGYTYFFTSDPVHKRKEIVKQCDVLIDGQYIDPQRDITIPYRGSKNQRLINIQQSLQKGEIVLWQI